MKPRKVIVTLEVETDAPLAAIKAHEFTASVFDWKRAEYHDFNVTQVSALVAQPVKPAQKAKR